MSDWRITFPSSAATQRVAQWATDRVEQIKAGEDENALYELRHDSWRTNFDFTGVPARAMKDMQAFATDAQVALARGDKEGAIAALTKLLIYVHPQA